MFNLQQLTLTLFISKQAISQQPDLIAWLRAGQVSRAGWTRRCVSAHSCAAGFVYISANWFLLGSERFHLISILLFSLILCFPGWEKINRLINESSKRCLKRALLAKVAVPSVHFFIVLVDGLNMFWGITHRNHFHQFLWRIVDRSARLQGRKISL